MTNAIKDLMCLKLKALDSLTELLPTPVKGHIRELENCLITAVNTATSEYIDKKKSAESEGDIKKVTIE